LISGLTIFNVLILEGIEKDMSRYKKNTFYKPGIFDITFAYIGFRVIGYTMFITLYTHTRT